MNKAAITAIVSAAVSSPAKPGTYKVSVKTSDGIKSHITVQAANHSEARTAVKGEAGFEVGSTVGVVRQMTAPATATQGAAVEMLSQDSINIEEFLAGIPADIKRVYEVDVNGQKVPQENPLVTALIGLSQTGIQSTTSLEIQRLAAENATGLAEFNRTVDIQIATERGANDIELANIRSKADTSIAHSQEIAARSIAYQQRITDQYVADIQSQTSKDVASTQASASGPYGFLGPMPEGGYTDDQIERLKALIHAEQKGSIDAAAATQAIKVAQTEAAAAALAQRTASDAATLQQRIAADTAQAEAAKIGGQDNLFSYAAANPETSTQDLANLAGMSPEARMAQAQVEAAKASADAQLQAAGLESARALEAAKQKGATDLEIANLTTQAQNLQQSIQTASNERIAALQTSAQTQVATTQAGAVTGSATTQAEMQKEAQIAIQALQDSAAIDELAKAKAIATIQAEAQTAGQLAQQELRETTILGELEKAQAIATLQQAMQITAQAAMAGLQSNQALSELDKAEAIAQIQEDTRQATNIALAEIQANQALTALDKTQIIAGLQAGATTTAATTQAGATTTAASTQAKASSPYGYLAGGGQLTDVETILSGQYNPFGQDSTDMLNLARAQASGGLTNEANILGVQQAAAATNPYAATQLGQDSGRIDQILRGGLTAEQQRQLTLAGQAGQMQGNYLNYISNPFAVGASQTLSGGSAAPFSQQQLQQVSDSPSGTIPSFTVGLGTSPFALPETQAIGSAQGLPANFTLGDWASRSDVEQQSVTGQLSPYGITPNMMGERAASYTPGSTQTVSSYT